MENVSSQNKDDSDIEEGEEEATLTEATQMLKKLTYVFVCTVDDMGESLRQIETQLVLPHY